MLTDADFALVAREVKARSGALLTRDIAGAAEARLAPLSRREGFSSVSEMLTAAKIRPDGKLWGAIADALAQTETRFFRDKPTFELLRKQILPEMFARRGNERVRIWSAGCATGQEAYSLAMLLDEVRQLHGGPIAEIVATDMSERLLDKARAGLYTQFEVQRGLPIRKLIAHFEKVGDLWRISDRLRGAVRFESHNLLLHPGALGQFDIVLCCNVISGLDPSAKLATLERVADALIPDGVLILGANETPPDGYTFGAADGALIRKTAIKRAA